MDIDINSTLPTSVYHPNLILMIRSIRYYILIVLIQLFIWSRRELSIKLIGASIDLAKKNKKNINLSCTSKYSNPLFISFLKYRFYIKINIIK